VSTLFTLPFFKIYNNHMLLYEKENAKKCVIPVY